MTEGPMLLFIVGLAEGVVHQLRYVSAVGPSCVWATATAGLVTSLRCLWLLGLVSFFALAEGDPAVGLALGIGYVVGACLGTAIGFAGVRRLQRGKGGAA